MIKLVLLFLFNCKSDTTIHFYCREMFPYNKTDTSFVEKDTVMHHHWPVGYYYKKDSLFMSKDVFVEYHMVKDRLIRVGDDTLKDKVIVVTCDSQVVKAIETYTFREGKMWPIKYVTLDNKPIHNICQVVDWNLTWIDDKEQRRKNPAFK